MRLRSQVFFTSLSKSMKHVGVFILAIFLTRYFSKFEYGTYLQIMLIANTAVYFAIFGIPASIYYFLPRVSEKRRMMKNTISLLFGISVVVSIIIFFSTDLLSSSFNNEKLTSYASLIAAFVLLQIPIKIFEPFMISTENVTKFVIVNGSFNLLFLLSILIPVLLDFQLMEILLSLFYFYIAQLVAIYFVVVIVYMRLKDKDTGDSYTISSQMSYSLPVGFSGAIAEIGKAIDKIIVSGFYNPAELATYARGAMEIPLLGVVANSLNNILMPKFVEKYKEGKINDVMSLWHGGIRMMAIFVYPTMVFFIATGDHLIPLLFTEQYLDSVIIFQIYTVVLLARVTSYDAIVRAVGKTKIMFKFTLVSVFLNIGLTVLFISSLGIVGAPLATILVTFLVRFGYLLVITKIMNVDIRKVFPWYSLGKILFASVISAIFIVPILMTSLSYFNMLLVCGLVYFIAYLIIFRFVKALPEKELANLRTMFPKKLRWVI